MPEPSENARLRNPLNGQFGQIINVDARLGALQAETAKLQQTAERHTGEISATTTAFIAEMTGVMDKILYRLEELVEQQTDPDGVRAITALAERLANQRTKRPVGFVKPEVTS